MVEVKKIKLTNGGETIVDVDDYEYLSKYNWQINTSGYVERGKYAGMVMGEKKSVKSRMHREIMGAKVGEEVDHINHNPLDNRKSNLRLCTRSQNAANRRKEVGKTSKYKGVGWKKRNKKWCAQIKVNQKNKHLGLFNCEVAAAQAYAAAAALYFGEFAHVDPISAAAARRKKKK